MTQVCARPIHAKGSRIVLDIDRWIDVPDNPAQRDTKKHAARAVKSHLKAFAVTHDKVSAATIDGEIVCKIDGHTRAWLWKSCALERPPRGVVYVDLYEVQSIREAADIYRQFDSPYAVETTNDRMCGAARLSGLRLTSPLLKQHKLMVATQIASSKLTGKQSQRYDGIENDLISLWSSELAALDCLQLPAGSLPSSVISLALLLFRVETDAEKVSRFLSDVAHKRMSVTPDMPACGVTHLVLLLDRRRAKKRMTGWCNLLDILGESLACWRRFRDGVLSARHVTIPADFARWPNAENEIGERR